MDVKKSEIYGFLRNNSQKSKNSLQISNKVLLYKKR